MRVLVMAVLALVLFLSACVSVDTGGSRATATPENPGNPPVVVTLDDNGRVFELKPGDRLLLKFGEGYDWTIEVADERVVSQVPGATLEPGTQGLYEARRAGQTELSAAGDPPCRKAQPPCAMPSRVIAITIVVR